MNKVLKGIKNFFIKKDFAFYEMLILFWTMSLMREYNNWFCLLIFPLIVVDAFVDKYRDPQ